MAQHRKRVSFAIEADRAAIAYKNIHNISYTEALNSLIINSDQTKAPVRGSFEEETHEQQDYK